MASVPSISVVIPTFNRARDLEKALRSVQAQTSLPVEIIVCDDGSTDGTPEVVKSVPGPVPIVYCYQDNSGLPASARNLGVRRAEGDFVAFLDSDDWWLPHKIQRMVEAGLDGFDVVYHPLFKVPRTSRLRSGRIARSRSLRQPVFTDLLRRGNIIPNSSAVVRKSVLVKVGGLNESKQARSWEDFDLWLRIAQISDGFLHVDEILGCYGTGEGISNPSQTLTNLENFIEIWGVADGKQPAWLRQQRALALAQLGRHREALAQSVRALGNPATMRFRSDFVLGIGLCGRAALKSIGG